MVVDFTVAISLGDFFGTCGEELGGSEVFGGWEGVRAKFGQGFPCLWAFFLCKD